MAVSTYYLLVTFLTILMPVCIAASLGIIFFVAPRYGKKYMLVYITVCSLIGGLSVSTISGIGSAVVLTMQGENQFKHWFLYFLIAFVIITLVTEIIYLNKALELFNTAMVTPVSQRHFSLTLPLIIVSCRLTMSYSLLLLWLHQSFSSKGWKHLP